MEKIKLLNNLPEKQLTPETDYLGLIDKGNLIKLFLESCEGQFSEIKMFALFGAWGSGKSSLMYYLEDQLKERFNTFFFDTWKFESDDNLSLSLLEFMIHKGKNPTKSFSEKLRKTGAKLLKGFAKSLKISFPPLGPANIEIDGKEITDNWESDPKKTFFQLKETFEKEFTGFEDTITQGKKKYNVIFIDDLDRCEPESILNLLAAIKLFFTHGKKTIFFFGLDKKAVEEAVRTKYNEIIKAEEYLEKIFDVSFSMPEHQDVLKLVSLCFDDRKIKCGTFEGPLNEKIAAFFGELKFTTPRKLKKVLNKFMLLRSYKTILSTNNSRYSHLIPNIYCGENEKGNYFETITCLYFIILHEFYKEKIDNFYNIHLKKINYRKAIDNVSNSEKERDLRSDMNSIDLFLNYHTFSLLSLRDEYEKRIDSRIKAAEMEKVLSGLIAQFSPLNPDVLKTTAFKNPTNYETEFQISKKEIDYYFSLYLFKNIDIFSHAAELSDYKLTTFQEMLGQLL